MKTTVVPAQMTTIEDRITSLLSVQQLLLLMAPLFLGAGIYALLPPLCRIATYKVLVCSGVLLLSCILALRIRGRLIGQWLMLLMRYYVRPRLYVYTKTDAYLRDIDIDMHSSSPLPDEATSLLSYEPLPTIRFSERMETIPVFQDEHRRIRFMIRKGGLHVDIT